MPFCPILSIKLFLWHVYNSPVFGNKNWEIGKKQTDGAREEGFVQLYFSSVLVRSLGTNIGKVEIEKKNKRNGGTTRGRVCSALFLSCQANRRFHTSICGTHITVKIYEQLQQN